MATRLPIPLFVTYMLGNWSAGPNLDERKAILVGVADLCWAIWYYRNDVVFDNVSYTSFMQTNLRGAYWLRF